MLDIGKMLDNATGGTSKVRILGNLCMDRIHGLYIMEVCYRQWLGVKFDDIGYHPDGSYNAGIERCDEAEKAREHVSGSTREHDIFNLLIQTQVYPLRLLLIHSSYAFHLVHQLLPFS